MKDEHAAKEVAEEWIDNLVTKLFLPRPFTVNLVNQVRERENPCEEPNTHMSHEYNSCCILEYGFCQEFYNIGGDVSNIVQEGNGGAYLPSVE